MVFAVVAQIVSGIKDGFYVVWIAFPPIPPVAKKVDMDIVFGQYLQDLCVSSFPQAASKESATFFHQFPRNKLGVLFR